jgi:hypothetical protein
LAVSIAAQEARGHQVLKKAMHRADRKSRETSNLLGGEPARRLAEKMQKPQAALQSRDVVPALWAASHVDFSLMQK